MQLSCCNLGAEGKDHKPKGRPKSGKLLWTVISERAVLKVAAHTHRTLCATASRLCLVLLYLLFLLLSASVRNEESFVITLLPINSCAGPTERIVYKTVEQAGRLLFQQSHGPPVQLFCYNFELLELLNNNYTSDRNWRLCCVVAIKETDKYTLDNRLSNPPSTLRLHRMEMCSYRPTDAELTSVIKMKMSLPVISSALLSEGNSKAASMIQLVHQQHPYLPKSDIGNAVAKVLQGYDWSLVPLASRWVFIIFIFKVSQRLNCLCL